jgi:hypothetical protein
MVAFPVPGSPARRSHAWLQLKLGRQRVIFKRQGDLCLQGHDQVVDAPQVVPIHLLHFLDLHVAGQVLGSKVIDELSGIQVVVAAQT